MILHFQMESLVPEALSLVKVVVAPEVAAAVVPVVQVFQVEAAVAKVLEQQLLRVPRRHRLGLIAPIRVIDDENHPQRHIPLANLGRRLG